VLFMTEIFKLSLLVDRQSSEPITEEMSSGILGMRIHLTNKVIGSPASGISLSCINTLP
jgi:hypothetical protein